MATKYKVFAYGSRKAFPAGKLAVGTCLPFDVFVNEGNVFTKLYGAGQLFGPEEKAALRRGGVTEVYVDAKDTGELDLYLQRTTEKISQDPNDPEVFREYLEHKERYHQVDRSFLVPGTRVDFGIYLLGDQGLTSLVEATERAPGVIPEGIGAAPGDVVIRNADIPLYRKHLDRLLKGSVETATAENREKIRAVVIKEKSKTIVKDLLEDPRSGENIKAAVELVTKMTDCILSNQNVIQDLISLSSYDYYTYTHSVNVSVLTVGIGIALGIGRADVEHLGVGALLHDVGKSVIPPEILNKKGRLSAQEFEIVKTHVLEGEKILRMHTAIHEDAFHVVLQHHERISGCGYPFRLAGGEVRLFGRICAIADCYDAMTTHRPYRPAGSPYQALLQLTKESQNYDSDLLATFIRMLGRIKSPEKARTEAVVSPPAV